MKESGRSLRRTSVVIAASAAVLLAGSLAALAIGGEREVHVQPSEAAGLVSASDFQIDELGWSGKGDKEPVLEAKPGQNAALVDCGSDAMEGSVLALADEGRAYCIQGVDSNDPDSVFAARAVAAKLITGGDYTDAELEVLRLETLLGYAKPESPEAAQYRDEYNAAWDALTKAEQDHLKE